MKNILITGASHGIGRAIACMLSDRGAFFVLNSAHDEKALHETAELMKQKNPAVKVKPMKGSVADRSFVAQMFSELEKAGGIDTLINSAGISYIGLLQDMREDQWDEVIGVNLKGVFNTCSLAIPQMLKKKDGRILNISSVWGSVGASCEACYSASKAGVDALTRSLAKELAPSGICVNAIACGLIDTRMNDHLSPEEKERLYEDIPAGREGEVSEVAELSLKLLESPKYMTGQIVRLDGGWI